MRGAAYLVLVAEHHELGEVGGGQVLRRLALEVNGLLQREELLQPQQQQQQQSPPPPPPPIAGSNTWLSW